MISILCVFGAGLLFSQDIPPPVDRPGARVPKVRPVPDVRPVLNTPAVKPPAVPPKSPAPQKPPAQSVQPAQPSVKPSVSAPKQIRFVMYKGIRYVRLSDAGGYFNLVLKRTEKGGVLEGYSGRVTYLYNSRAGSVNGVVVSFLHPVLLLSGTEYISELDFRKVLFPVLLKRHGAPRHAIRSIMIDAGHGGADPGAKGPVRSEKAINLEIANRLGAKLRALGFRVMFTRGTDTALSLDQRADWCAKMKPDLFISIHCNSSTSRSVNGIEVFALTPGGAVSTAGGSPGAHVAANAFDSNNYLLAYEIQRSLVGIVRFPDRGVKHSRFYVLRNSSCPSVLIECGFLSNAVEGRKLAQPIVQERIASAILSGLARYAARIR